MKDDRAARRARWWTWPVLVPLLGIPALIIAVLVSSLIRTPPDFCGLPHGITCQQADAQINAARLAAYGSQAFALAIWLVAFLPRAPRGLRSWRAVFVLAGNSAMLCGALLALRVRL